MTLLRGRDQRRAQPAAVAAEPVRTRRSPPTSSAHRAGEGRGAPRRREDRRALQARLSDPRTLRTAGRRPRAGSSPAATSTALPRRGSRADRLGGAPRSTVNSALEHAGGELRPARARAGRGRTPRRPPRPDRAAPPGTRGRPRPRRRRRGAPPARRRGAGSRTWPSTTLARIRLFEPVALVVDDEHRAHRARARARRARRSRARRSSSRNAKRSSRRTVGRRREPGAELAAGEPADQRPELARPPRRSARGPPRR